MTVNIFHHHDRTIDHHTNANGESPNDIKFALSPYHFIMMKAKSADSGRTSVTMKRAPHIRQEHDQDNEDKNRAFP